jgi:tetratricopeptide (TPR) repeat protein
MAKQRRTCPSAAVEAVVAAGSTSTIGTSSEAIRLSEGGKTRQAGPVGIYEQGMQALQRHEFEQAAGIFRALLEQYPEELELRERARLYLNVCARQTTPADQTPLTLEERVNHATLAINAGAYDEGLQKLQVIEGEAPDNDHAQYMLGVVHALRGDQGQAVHHLLRAIALNPENRLLARHDPDLDRVRRDERLRVALSTPTRRRGRRRRRPRSSR